MTVDSPHASSRLRNASLAPIGEEGRSELVAIRLVKMILTGAYIHGERLPTEPELAELLGVALITVREGLGKLRSWGYIETRRGRTGGSFVKPTHADVLRLNSRHLTELHRIALADFGVHYEVISTACAEYACRRATPDELDAVLEAVTPLAALPTPSWRRQITDVQLEIAALSQSVRLTNEHIRVHTEGLPLFSLQDSDPEMREHTHTNLVAKVRAIRDGDTQLARQIAQRDIRATIRWLVAYRAKLLEGADPDATRADAKLPPSLKLITNLSP